MTLDELFNGPPQKFEHPLLRQWEAQLATPGTEAKLGLVQYAPDLGQVDTQMFVRFVEGDKESATPQRPWDDDLNAGLIELGVRALDEAQEVSRFTLGLNAALRKATREFGDGFCNTVLVKLLTESELTPYHEIAEVLRHAHVNPIYPKGPIGLKGLTFERYSACRELIANAIGGRAKELRDLLHYSPDDAKEIMIKALAQFLDQRFSVSARIKLGRL